VTYLSPLLADGKRTQPTNGALAYHRESGSFGFAVNAATPRTAKLEALGHCANPKCEIVANLRNDCGAVANGPKRYVTSRGATRAEAETKALRLCGERCVIAGWACTR
jgi:hypothetical protein